MSSDPPPPSAPAVLLLITNLNFGGAQRVFHGQSLFLAEHFPVTEVVFNLDHGHAFPSGNRLVSLEVSGGGGPITKARNFLRRIRRLRRVKQHTRAALCISHMAGADYVNVLSRVGDKVILVVHGSKLHDRTSRGLAAWTQNRLLLPLLYNRADRIVTVSRDIVPELVALGVHRDKLRTINNFFDADAIRERAAKPLTSQEEAIFAGPPVLVTAGRHHAQKNPAALIEIIAQVRRRAPARLALIGDGPLRDELIAQARALGLATWDAWSGAPLPADCDVYFLGYQDNPFKFLRRGTLFLLTSSWEGLPMVLGEAMACGVPILSTDCATGPREFLAPASGERPAESLLQAERGQSGVLLPLLDGSVPRSQAVAMWVDTVVELLGDPTQRQRLAANAALRIADFSRETIAEQWLALITELLQPVSPR